MKQYQFEFLNYSLFFLSVLVFFLFIFSFIVWLVLFIVRAKRKKSMMEISPRLNRAVKLFKILAIVSFIGLVVFYAGYRILWDWWFGWANPVK